jgi:plastocyanin
MPPVRIERLVKLAFDQIYAPRARAPAPAAAGSATVTTVACTGTPPIVSTDSDLAMHYTYSTGSAAPAIAVGGIVNFMLTTAHNAAPALSGGDPGLKVPYGGDICLKFSKAGTFGFYCTKHGFTGTVTVN